MKIGVKVVPGAKIEQVKPSIGLDLKVWVKGKPKEGEANKCVVVLIANHFKVPKSQIKIVSGHKSRNKIIEIIESTISA